MSPDDFRAAADIALEMDRAKPFAALLRLIREEQACNLRDAIDYAESNQHQLNATTRALVFAKRS
jgi:hypothetical protein